MKTKTKTDPTPLLTGFPSIDPKSIVDSKSIPKHQPVGDEDLYPTSPIDLDDEDEPETHGIDMDDDIGIDNSAPSEKDLDYFDSIDDDFGDN